MERVSNLLNKAEQEKSLATTQPHSQPSWAGLLWTLAQSRTKELTTAEVALWKAKLSGYPSDLVEWALVNYNGEFFPNPSTICQMIERKRESLYAEHEQAAWPAWKATQAQAEREGQLATDEDYEQLRRECREILAKAKPITAAGRPHNNGVMGVEKPVHSDDPTQSQKVEG